MQSHLDPLRLLTIAELAALAGQSPDTIERRIHDGTIKAVRLGRYWRIPLAEARRYLGYDDGPDH